MDDIESPFQIQSTDSHVQIVDQSGRVILECGDRTSAEQYVTLLNQAFTRGFKAGFRAAKRGSELP